MSLVLKKIRKFSLVLQTIRKLSLKAFPGKMPEWLALKSLIFDKALIIYLFSTHAALACLNLKNQRSNSKRVKFKKKACHGLNLD